MPLWKQLLGACAGATVAVVVYQAFLFVSPQVQAWLTIPTAPGVTQQDKAVITGDKDGERLARQEQRNRQILEKFGQAMSSSSVPVAMHAAAQSSVASSASSRAISGGLKGVVDATKSILNGTSSSAATVSSASSAPSPVAAPAARSSSSRRSGNVAPVVTKGSDFVAPSVPRSERLPNSGVGLWLAASAAFGATTVRRRMMHKAANA